MHLIYNKLLALCSVGQYSLQKLLFCLSLNKTTIVKDENETNEDKAARAISVVLQASNKLIRTYSNLFISENNKQVIYKDFDKGIFNDKIDAFNLDITALVDILLRTDIFKVSQTINLKGITCSSPKHMTRIHNCCIFCADPKHLRSMCNKDRCKSQYCEKNSKCTHPLLYFAIEQLLNYLKSEDEGIDYMEMHRHLEFMRIVTTATKHHHLEIYTPTINKYLELECLKKIEEKMNNLTKSHSLNLLRIAVEFEFGNSLKRKVFDLTKSKYYNDIFKKATKDKDKEQGFDEKVFLRCLQNHLYILDGDCESILGKWY